MGLQQIPKKLVTATGEAPSYSARAWVKFDGTISNVGTVLINGSGNVSSVTDFGVGTYIVNFINPMNTVHYGFAISGKAGSNGANVTMPGLPNMATPISDTSIFVQSVPTGGGGGGAVDVQHLSLVVFE